MTLIGNVLKPLGKSVLIPLGLTAAAVAASAIDAAVHKKMFESDVTTLIISNEEMNDMKIVQSLEEYGLLRKDVSKTIKNEAKKQKRGFLSMLLGALGASLFGNLLTGKGTIRAGGRTVRPGQEFLMPPHLLTNFEMQEYYQNKPKFSGVYSRNNLSKIKDGGICNKS